MQISERKYILVRSGINPEEKSVVGIGFSEVPFNKFDNAEDIIKEINKLYSIGRKGNQVRLFKGIKKGDVIVVPLSRSIALAIAEEGEIFDSTSSNVYSENQRAVSFLRDEKANILKIPRINLKHTFQDRLKIRRTVADLWEFRCEIDHLLEKPDVSFWDDSYRKECENEIKEFKQTLISNIREGRNKLSAGGLGLENLIKELLEINGYDDFLPLTKQTFPSFADADIAASNLVSRILIQVKHHGGNSGPWGIEQLKEIKRICPEDYKGYQFVFLTSANVEGKLRDEAESLGFIVIDGDELADWILSSMDKLSEKTKMILGISEIPHILKCC
jgi:restriction system protein